MAKNTIKLNEAQLRNIVKESIKNVIKEHEENNNQWMVYNYAKQLMNKLGYKLWDENNDNPYVLTVSINNYSDIDRIDKILRRELGVQDNTDMSVKQESNMFGNDQRAKIILPAITHTNMNEPKF